MANQARGRDAMLKSHLVAKSLRQNGSIKT